MTVRLFDPFASELGGVPLESSGAPVITPVFLGNFSPGCFLNSTEFPVTNGPVTWSIVSGALPSGLAISDGASSDFGLISGASTDQGTFSFTIRATNGAGFDEWATSIVMTDWEVPDIDPVPFDFNGSLAVGIPDTVLFFENGPGQGVNCNTWTVTSGAIPTGMTLASNESGASIGGTPTTSGTYSFTLRDENPAGFDTQAFSLTVAGGDGTATPSAIALAATVPAPTATGGGGGGGTATPAAITRSVVTAAPTASGSSTTAPSAITRSVVVPAPTASGGGGGSGGTATPAAITRTVVTPAPSVVRGGARATPTTITPSVVVPCIVPANDNWANAIPLIVGTPVTALNCGATRQVGEPVPTAGGGGFYSLWWKFDGTPVEYTVSTVGSDFDTVVAVYTGASLGALVEVGSDDDSGGSGTSLLTFTGTTVTYYVQVSGYFDDSFGEVVLLVDSIIVVATLAASWGPMTSSAAASVRHVVPAVLAASW